MAISTSIPFFQRSQRRRSPSSLFVNNNNNINNNINNNTKNGIVPKSRTVVVLCVVVVFSFIMIWVSAKHCDRFLHQAKLRETFFMAGKNKTTTTAAAAIGAERKDKVLSYYDYEPPTSPIIAYVSMGPASRYQGLRDRFEAVFSSSSNNNKNDSTYRFFYHSFDEDCDGCIFKEKTSFAQGKNILIKAVATSNEFLDDDDDRRRRRRIKYVVSFDSDVPLFLFPPKRRRSTIRGDDANTTTIQQRQQKQQGQQNKNNGWHPFHELLLHPNTTHPFIKPRYMGDLKNAATTFQSCTDENFWTIRSDHLSVIYPHSTYQHQDFYWSNAIRIFYLLERCYPAAMMVHADFATENPSHTYKTSHYDYEDIQHLAVDMLRADYAALGPWEDPKSMLGTRCTIKDVPSIGLNHVCKEVMEDRFQRWIDGEFEP